MNPAPEMENEALRRSWQQYDCDHLDTYLVSGIEDPRINCQSILTRALIADTLWPDSFIDLIDAELRFGSVLTWILLRLEEGVARCELLSSVENASESCPKTVVETYNSLRHATSSVPDYVTDAIMSPNPDGPPQALCETALNTFCEIWRSELEHRTSVPVSLLEPACGSANDYRFIHSFGLARFVRYTGFDIAPKNVSNAQSRFPDVPFFIGSVFDTGLAEGAFDYVVVHDLFEHLSPEGLEAALAEVMRVAGRQAWLHFFNLSDCDSHVIRPIDNYYSNLLSIRQIGVSLSQWASDVDIVRIPDLLKEKFGFDAYYNAEATTLIVTK